MGMEKRPYYIATKVINDKFIALGKDNVLTTWDVLTGKIKKMCRLQESNQDYSNYELFQFDDKATVYKREWYDKILIRSKTPIANYDENQFFAPEQYNPYIKRQTTFIKSIKKEFYEYKLIEVVNEHEVKEHFSFIHPFYDKMQMMHYLYINNTQDLMLERIAFSKLFLYRKVELGEGNRVKWQQI